MNKALLLKILALLGINGIAEDATDEAILTAVTNHKPKDKHVVIDFEDKDVKAAFKSFITAETKDLTDKITAVEDENTRLKGLLENGAGANGGANKPIENNKDPKKEGKTITRAEFEKLPHSARNTFFKEGGKLEG